MKIPKKAWFGIASSLALLLFLTLPALSQSSVSGSTVSGKIEAWPPSDWLAGQSPRIGLAFAMDQGYTNPVSFTNIRADGSFDLNLPTSPSLTADVMGSLTEVLNLDNADCTVNVSKSNPTARSTWAVPVVYDNTKSWATINIQELKSANTAIVTFIVYSTEANDYEALATCPRGGSVDFKVTLVAGWNFVVATANLSTSNPTTQIRAGPAPLGQYTLARIVR